MKTTMHPKKIFGQISDRWIAKPGNRLPSTAGNLFLQILYGTGLVSGSQRFCSKVYPAGLLGSTGISPISNHLKT